MINSSQPGQEIRLVLAAATAADLMTPNPRSIRQTATIGEAVGFLTDKGFSAAPVIDEGGRPVGVLSRADIVAHDRATADYLRPVAASPAEAGWTGAGGGAAPGGLRVEASDFARVREVMAPAVFSVTPDTPAGRVVEEMLARKVHQLFVVTSDGILVGVISDLDVLRHLRPGQPPEPATTPPRLPAGYQPLGHEPW
jgi:CBS domain-containing protein